MKNILLVLALAFSVSNAFSQAISDVSTGTILSPFISATKLMETTAVSVLRTVQSTRSLVQMRGVAGKEQLKDELMELNEAMVAGRIKTIAQVEQPGLLELFEEIKADEKQMEEISTLVSSGSELHRVATVVAISLLLE